jgi:hypothetical protein
MEPVDPTEFFDGNDRVLNLMNLRRNASNTTAHADAIKSTLCNKIQELVHGGVGLRDRIVAISEIDPELSAYIMALESINGGIWCAKCGTTKSLGGVVSASTKTLNVPAPTSDQSLEISKLRAHLHSAKEELALLKNENAAINGRLELITVKLDSYNNRISAFTVPTVDTASVHKSAPRHPLLDIKKEDLPPAPEELKFELPAVFDSADSLLE